MTVADDYTPTTEEVRGFYIQAGEDWGDGVTKSAAEFDRWLAALRAEWEAEQGEPEWEWAVESTYPYNVVHSGWTDEETAREIASWPITGGTRRLVRRRKAGPTLPVPDTTNHETTGAKDV